MVSYRQKAEFITLTSTYPLHYCDLVASNVLSKEENLFIQCPLKKTKNPSPKTEFLWQDFTIQLLLVLKSTPFSAFGEAVVGQ